MHPHKPFGFQMPHAVPRGFLKQYVLKLLSTKPMHGYEIMDEIQKKSNGFWRPSAGSVYPTLMWLEDRSLIEAVPSGEKEEGKKVYQITMEGRAYLAECMKRFDEISNRIRTLGAFWLDFIYPKAWSEVALRSLERHLLNLKEGVKYASTEALEDVRPIIEKVKKDLFEISKEIDEKIAKGKS